MRGLAGQPMGPGGIWALLLRAQQLPASSLAPAPLGKEWLSGTGGAERGHGTTASGAGAWGREGGAEAGGGALGEQHSLQRGRCFQF